MSSFGRHYILLPDRTIVEVDMMEWAHWFETADRHIGLTVTEFHTISTIFLGLDHRFGFGNGPPILFETMVFDKEGHDSPLVDFPVHTSHDCMRYSSLDDAEAGHAAMVRRYLKMEAEAASASMQREREKRE